MAICGHAPHGEVQEDLYVDMSSLMRERPRNAKNPICGAFNADMLPDHICDPYDATDHDDHHKDDRLRLKTFLTRWNFNFEWPTHSVGMPGGGYNTNSRDSANQSYSLDTGRQGFHT
eukprot:7888629-Karenia_brevis.AAC.2